MAKRKQSLKQPISFKENVRDLAIYNYLESIKNTFGKSNYLKNLVEEDMRKKGLWKEEYDA